MHVSLPRKAHETTQSEPRRNGGTHKWKGIRDNLRHNQIDIGAQSGRQIRGGLECLLCVLKICEHNAYMKFRTWLVMRRGEYLIRGNE